MLAGIRERFRPLRAEIFPRVVLLDFSDPQLLVGQGIKGGRPQQPVWTAPVPARTLRDGVPIAPDALGDFIGDLLLEHSTPDASLVVALPRPASVWRVITWPGGVTPEDPLEALLDLNPNLQLPFPLSQATLDLQPVPGVPGRSQLVAAERRTVQAWIDLIAIAGGSLRHLLPSPACLTLALRQELEVMGGDELLMLLQPTATACLVDVWVGGVLEFEHSLPRQPEGLGPALQRTLTFCQGQFGATASRLLVSGDIDGVESLEQALNLPLEPVDLAGYGTLTLRGLADLEMAR